MAGYDVDPSSTVSRRTLERMGIELFSQFLIICSPSISLFWMSVPKEDLLPMAVLKNSFFFYVQLKKQKTINKYSNHYKKINKH
jgi:hypothetical protein